MLCKCCLVLLMSLMSQSYQMCQYSVIVAVCLLSDTEFGVWERMFISTKVIRDNSTVKNIKNDWEFI